jgi:hypothetical protein
MPRVTFTPSLQRYVECPTLEVGGATVRAALDEVFTRNPRLRGYVLDDQGRLRQHVAVFLDAQPVFDRGGLSDAARADSEIFVLQALSGG